MRSICFYQIGDWLLIMYGILPQQLFFVAAVVYSGSWDFLYGRCKQLFVSEFINAYFSRHLFYNSVWVAKSCITVCFTYSLKNGDFLNTHISQGSVATRGGVFVYDFVTNFLLILTVKEFWKSVNIWWSYGQELNVLFFWLSVVFIFSLWRSVFLRASGSPTFSKVEQYVCVCACIDV